MHALSIIYLSSKASSLHYDWLCSCLVLFTYPEVLTRNSFLSYVWVFQHLFSLAKEKNYQYSSMKQAFKLEI